MIAPVVDDAPAVNFLAPYRWRSWVVVIAAAAADPRAPEQARLLAADPQGCRERALAAVRSTPALAARLGAVGFAVLLVGKDGYVVARFDRPVPAADLFRRIDAMPMRAAEMRGN